jgi:hypothetical protein
MSDGLTGGSRPALLRRAAATGAGAGLAAAAVMAAVEKLEQAATSRPDSYVPGRTLGTLVGRSPSDAEEPVALNYAMHYATGAALGALRGMWSVVGLRGVRANVTHSITRLATDQTLENTSGAGAPPSSWPVQEQIIDYAHKAIYSFVCGAIADRLIQPVLESRRGTKSH